MPQRRLPLLHSDMESPLEAQKKLITSLGLLPETILRAEHAGGNMAQERPARGQVAGNRGPDPEASVTELGNGVHPKAAHDFSRGRRGRSSEIRDKIRDREIDFMPDSRDH